MTNENSKSNKQKKSNSHSSKPKGIQLLIRSTEKHWVGDGFYVSTLFYPTEELYALTDPFILLDYGAPRIFEISQNQRGVGWHPHRGFETVTFALQGEISHRDTGGGGGTIQAGGIQWMTAGKGVLHEELFSKKFSSQGGTLEMVQLWVNLPAEKKMCPPRYQSFEARDFPEVALGTSGSFMRLISGNFDGNTGPAQSHTPLFVCDLVLKSKAESPPLALKDQLLSSEQSRTQNQTQSQTEKKDQNIERIRIPLTETSHTVCLILEGSITVANQVYPSGDLIIFTKEGDCAEFHLAPEATGARVLVLNGEPIGEKIVAHGPFVMNTMGEIKQAIIDYQLGKMGTPPREK